MSRSSSNGFRLPPTTTRKNRRLLVPLAARDVEISYRSTMREDDNEGGKNDDDDAVSLVIIMVADKAAAVVQENCTMSCRMVRWLVGCLVVCFFVGILCVCAGGLTHLRVKKSRRLCW